MFLINCKTEEMCDKVIVENGGMFGFIPDCFKDEKCEVKMLIIVFMH